MGQTAVKVCPSVLVSAAALPPITAPPTPLDGIMTPNQTELLIPPNAVTKSPLACIRHILILIIRTRLIVLPVLLDPIQWDRDSIRHRSATHCFCSRSRPRTAADVGG